MDNSKEIIVNFIDLPNYKDVFADPLKEFGVSTIDQLREVLKDKERTASLISAVKGLGPKTVQSWKNALKESETADEECRTESEIQTPAEEQTIEVPTMEEPAPETIPQEDGPSANGEVEAPAPEAVVSPVMPKVERSLFCTMADLKEIQRTTTDLLRMNGSKKKGQMASAEYVSKRLTETGLDVTVNGESGFPTIVATKGEGGVVLWGHLDTERMKGMKKSEQGDILGDMIHGRGAANMKGAIATMICAANRLSTWQVPFSIALTTDGLGEQLGAEALAKNPLIQNAKGILMLGPTSMRPVIGQTGYAALKVRTSGDQAVMKMASFLKSLTGHIEESRGRISVKTGLIRGGKKKRPFESPQSCEVIMEVETLDATDSAITMLQDLAASEESEIEVLCQSNMTEFDRSSDLATAVTELTKNEPVTELSHSEAAMIAQVNRKMVIFGPGTALSTVSDQEYVSLSELETTYEFLLRLIDWSYPLD